ncbi:MAG: hypothetical protein OEQ39_04420 [Gammaproteobacteria bacterium]|nr:hypothetical protein [Gammaproteobacteria bacterium]
MALHNDMTAEELAEWGRRENKLRQDEMANVTSADDLSRIQKACAGRRKTLGLSAGQAAWWVTVGQRLDRGDSLSYAMRRR